MPLHGPPDGKGMKMDNAFRRLPLVVALAVSSWLGTFPSAAVDLYEPSEVTLTVVDEAGRAMSGAAVQLGDESRISDERGEIRYVLRHPPWKGDGSNVGWWVAFEALSETHYGTRWVECFPGARLASRLEVSPYQETTVRLLGPEDKPLAEQPFVLRYRYPEEREGTYTVGSSRSMADEHGECIVRLPKSIRVAGVDLGAGTCEAALAGSPVTCRFEDKELPSEREARRLSLLLLRADGRPAAGWQVAADFSTSEEGAVSGGADRGPTQHTLFHARQHARSNAEGLASVVATGRHLGIRSPDGHEFLYPLEPGAWPEGDRRITLTLPGLRRVQEGRLIRSDGQPVSDDELSQWHLRCVHGLGRFYRLSFGSERKGRAGDLFARRVRTGGRAWPPDAEGRYAIPVAHGTVPWIGSLWFPDNPAAAQRVVLHVATPKDVRPPQLKRVSIIIVDDAPRPTDVRCGGFHDTRGHHLLLPRDVDRTTLHVESPGWEVWEPTIDVRGSHDRTLVLERPAHLRGSPLRGRVLDPRGRPLEGAVVALRLAPNTPNTRATSDRSTDAEGRFVFELAPPRCTITVERLEQGPLPGWASSLPVDRDQRDVDLRLSEGGTVVVRLAGRLPEDVRLYLSSRQWPRARGLAYDPAARAWIARHVPPGEWELRARKALELFRAPEIAGVVVAEGRKSAIEIVRGGAEAGSIPPGAARTVWQEVDVTMGGKPYSGAVVTVYEPDAGAGGRCVLRDLADERGRARFAGREGVSYVVVARAPGRGVGWQTAAVAPHRRVSVEMIAARTLAIELTSGRTESWRSFLFRWPELSAPERTALRIALDMGCQLPRGEVYSEHRASGLDVLDDEIGRSYDERCEWVLQREGRQRYIAQDLPVGRTFLVEEEGTRREITLSPKGEGELVVQWP